MRETPAQFNEWLFQTQAQTKSYPMGSLARYRFHTGATLRPLASEEICPVLFRDIGSVAMAKFLDGRLRRLAGAYTPITYMRTEEYIEPYEDFTPIGRLIFLRPLELQPWHSGVEHIYISRATHQTSAETLGYVPGNVSLDEASLKLSLVSTTQELREALGGNDYDQSIQEAKQQLRILNLELEQSEELALPLRKMLQSTNRREKDMAREFMLRQQITETDLCSAWHHIPQHRREHIKAALNELRTERPTQFKSTEQIR